MLIGACRVIEKAQCNPSGEKLAFGESRPAFHAMRACEIIGILVALVSERIAGEEVPFLPPFFLMLVGWGRLQEEFDSAVLSTFTPAPSGAVIDETGVLQESIGYGLDGGVDTLGSCHEMDARIGEGTFFGRDEG